MYIIVQHQVRDPQTFLAGIRASQDALPPGIDPLQVLPNADGTSVTCLWKADSLDSVRAVVEDSVGSVSENRYYEVNTDAALGLPR
jgi:hypothetical protein